MSPLAVLVALSLAAPPEPVRRAVVVAYNGPESGALPPLRYADDDGLRWAQLLERLGWSTALLTVADEETARQDGATLARTRRPTPAELEQVADEVGRANAADRARGRSTDALLVFVGHGRRDPSGHAELLLLGGAVDRRWLFERVVDRLGADFTHLVLDACQAEGLVGARGEAATLQRLQQLLEKEQLATRPGTGALFAQSDTGETHEWSALRAGVFSHTLRSGLSGAADVNGDGRIEYSELQAFTAAALARIPSAPVRLSVHARAPAQDPHRALVSAAPQGPELFVPAEEAVTRFSLEDERGVRLVDVHREPGEPLLLRLPASAGYWLRTGEGGARLHGDGRLSVPALRPATVTGRGPAEEGLREGFFSAAYGRAFYEGFVSSSGTPGVRFLGPRSPPASPAGLPRFEVALTGGTLPLGLGGVEVGVAGAFRHAVGPLHVGARVGYGLGPAAQLPDGESGRLHRVSVLALVGVGLDSLRVAPFVELGAGWQLVLLERQRGLEGDPLGLLARGALGARVRVGPTRLGVAVVLEAQSVNEHSQRRLDWVPGGELSVQF